MAVLLPIMPASLSLPLGHMTAAHSEPDSPDSPVTSPDTSLTPMPTAKKPKLSLQTTSLNSTYGSLTRGLAANQQSIYTPTTTNTLSNTWDLSYRPSPVSRTESPKPLQISRLQTPSLQEDQPYNLSLPFGVRSILKNSPLQIRASSISASPRDSKRKLFFPQPKKVVFRRNLEDVIHTTRYTAKHSDISSSEDDSSGEGVADIASTSEHTSLQTSPPPTRKRKERRDSGIHMDSDTTKEDTIAKQEGTEPRVLKTCKRRKWQWSLSTSESTSPEEQANRPSSGDQNSETDSEDEQGHEQTPAPSRIQDQLDST